MTAIRFSTYSTMSRTAFPAGVWEMAWSLSRISEAVQLFNQYVEQYEMLRQQAEDSGMALTQMEAAAGGCYTWLDDPWPWDAETEE